MSSIEKFFTKIFTVKRQEWSGDSSSNISQGTFNGHIQQGVAKAYQEDLGFRFTKAYTIWCPSDTDVQEGDRLEDGSDTYDVRFLINRGIGDNGHLELIVEKNG